MVITVFFLAIVATKKFLTLGVEVRPLKTVDRGRCITVAWVDLRRIASSLMKRIVNTKAECNGWR